MNHFRQSCFTFRSPLALSKYKQLISVVHSSLDCYNNLRDSDSLDGLRYADILHVKARFIPNFGKELVELRVSLEFLEVFRLPREYSPSIHCSDFSDIHLLRCCKWIFVRAATATAHSADCPYFKRQAMGFPIKLCFLQKHRNC